MPPRWVLTIVCCWIPVVKANTTIMGKVLGEIGEHRSYSSCTSCTLPFSLISQNDMQCHLSSTAPKLVDSESGTFCTINFHEKQKLIFFCDFLAKFLLIKDPFMNFYHIGQPE